MCINWLRTNCWFDGVHDLCIKYCNGVQSLSEMKVRIKVWDEGKRMKRKPRNKEWYFQVRVYNVVVWGCIETFRSIEHSLYIFLRASFSNTFNLWAGDWLLFFPHPITTPVNTYPHIISSNHHKGHRGTMNSEIRMGKRVWNVSFNWKSCATYKRIERFIDVRNLFKNQYSVLYIFIIKLTVCYRQRVRKHGKFN